jgi:SAM-dependent MidA family methyltransferase
MRDNDAALARRLMKAPASELGDVATRDALARLASGGELARRVVRDGGAALLIDYGRASPGFGDTLQALVRHQKVDPLAGPGEADLTMHADFPAVLDAARAEGAWTAILTQSVFSAVCARA